jgi:hypothetical protein
VEHDPRYRFEYVANEAWWKPLGAAAAKRLGLINKPAL